VHRWLVILMVTLLPLRVWAGDAMAVQMAAAQWSPAAMEAGMAHLPDCPGRMAAADAAGTAPDAQGNGAEPACASCTLCQVCSTVALELLAPPASLLPPWQGVGAWPEPGFSSAPAALRFKPPIS
jgi:hypothetical protein